MGNYVFAFRSQPVANIEYRRLSNRLMKVSRSGDVLWEALAETGDNIVAWAMDTTALFYTLTSASQGHFFVARCVRDGSILHQSAFPIPWRSTSAAPFFKLLKNKRWAAIGCTGGDLYILDTITRKVLYRIYVSRNSRLIFSNVIDTFWVLDAYDHQSSWLRCYAHTYNTDTNSFSPSKNWSLCLDQECTSIGFDLDQQRSFSIEVNLDKEASLFLGPISAPFRPETNATREIINLEETALVTLPSDTPSRWFARRELSFWLPSTKRGTALCTMVGDYLVVHAPDDQTLVVVDFWPTW